MASQHQETEPRRSGNQNDFKQLPRNNFQHEIEGSGSHDRSAINSLELARQQIESDPHSDSSRALVRLVLALQDEASFELSALYEWTTTRSTLRCTSWRSGALTATTPRS